MNPANLPVEANAAQDRHAWRTRFLTRVHRFRRLLLSKWWIPILGIGLGVGVQFLLYSLEKPLFTSLGRLIVSSKLAIPDGAVFTEEMGNFLGTQGALMQSESVRRRAIERVRAQSTNLTPCEVSLKVTILPKTTIFLISATGESQEYTSAFLQADMDEFILLKRQMRLETSDQTLASLEEEVLKLQRELRKSDAELVAFRSSNSVVLLQEQGNNAISALASLNSRLSTLKSERELLEMLTLDQNLERRQQAGTPLPAAEELIGQNTTGGANAVNEAGKSDYFRAKQQLLLLKAEVEDLGQYLKPKHPKMVLLREEIARRERLLGIFRQQSKEQLESWKSSLDLQLQNLEKDVREADARCLDVSRKTAEYERLKTDAQRTQQLYDRLLATMQTLDVNKQISPESVNVLERASPALPDRGILINRLIIGGVAGLFLSFLILMLIDRLDDRMNSFIELQELFTEPVLAQIPREATLGTKGGTVLIGPEDTRHSFVESHRNLRSSLLFSGENGTRPRTLLVTSSVPSEGKSVTCTNLAATMANSGVRVLLVDADLRRGTLHSHFGLSAEPGLSEILSKGLRVQDAVRPTKVPNLWIISRGALTPHSSELFVSPAMETFVKEVAAQYEYVVVDTAPVMAADDVTSLAPLLDATLFVVRSEYTSARIAHAALHLLYQRRVNVLGVIFNAVRPTAADYYYYKYHDYYSTYPAKR